MVENNEQTRRKIRFVSAGVDELVVKANEEIWFLESEHVLPKSLYTIHTHEYLDDRVVIVNETRRVEQSPPPSSAILSAVLPTSISEDVIANLSEVFQVTWLRRHGERTARQIWKVQAALIVLRYWLSPILSVLDRIKPLKTGGL
jgi:hypothetical protein